MLLKGATEPWRAGNGLRPASVTFVNGIIIPYDFAQNIRSHCPVKLPGTLHSSTARSVLEQTQGNFHLPLIAFAVQPPVFPVNNSNSFALRACSF